MAGRLGASATGSAKPGANELTRMRDDARPVTSLYRDFLMRHALLPGSNPQMALQVKNVARVTDAQQAKARGTSARRVDPPPRSR